MDLRLYLGMYSCVALPLWGAVFALYFILRRNGLARQSLIAKCAGTFLAVGSAGVALWLKGENPFCRPFFWFFVLCMAADALLELHFLSGMLLFGVAHVCWIVEMLENIPLSIRWSLPIWVIAMVAALILFRRELPKMGVQAVFCSLYVGILAASLAICLPLPLIWGKAGMLLFSVGMLSFFVSDMMVAKAQFSQLGDRLQKPIMFLYWLALYLLSCTLWL